MASSFLRRAVAMAALALLVSASAHAAEPSAADKETARRMMIEGRASRDANDLAGALKAFTVADQIMRVPSTGLEVARAAAALGRLVEARDVALRVARSTPEPGEPAPFAAARKAAEELDEELVKRIPTVLIHVEGSVAGTPPQVTVDGVEVRRETLDLPRAIDPGKHEIVATQGASQGKTAIEIGEGQKVEATVTLVAPLPIVEAPRPTPPPPVENKGDGIGKPLAFGGAGLAVVGIVTGSITGLLSLSKTSTAKDLCRNDRCPPSAAGAIDSARSMATISNVSFIVAGVGAAVGITGWLLWRSTPATDAKTSSIEPWIGLGMAGARGRF